MAKRSLMYLLAVFLILGGVSQAAVTTYATRLAFDLAHPGVPVEDFEEAADDLAGITSPYLNKFVMEDGQSLDASTSNDVFNPGEILDGLEIYSSGGESQRLAVLGVGSDHHGMLVSDVTITNTNDAAKIVLAFPDGVNVVAFDVYFESPNDVGIKVFNAADELISGYEFEIDTNFFGIYSSDELIYRIEIDSPSGTNNGYFEFIDNVAFGTVEPTPEEKMAEIIDFFEEAVDDGGIMGDARGWYGKIQLLANFWKRLRVADYQLMNDLKRSPCKQLANLEKFASRNLTGKSVPDLIDMINELRMDLGCLKMPSDIN